MKTSLSVWNLLYIFLFLSACASSKRAKTPSMEVNNSGIHTESMAKTDPFLTDLLKSYPQYFDTLLKNNDTWKIQIIYTQIDRNQEGSPAFTHYYYNVNPNQYFYPASTVKLPIAVLALQRLNELNIKGLNKETAMITEVGTAGLTGVSNDTTSIDGRASIAQYIRKILLVSDNDAYNRLYEFLGQEYINNRLHAMGYGNAQIIHRLDIVLNEEQNRTTNPVRFVDGGGQTVYQQPLVRSKLSYQQRQTLLGNGYYSQGKLVMQPFDFSKKNRLALTDLHSIVQSILFPETVAEKQRFNLKKEDYAFLYRYMSMYPQESASPSYDSTYNNAYVKFLLYGSKDPVLPNVRIFNKVGDAYGFLTDAAYVVDFDNKIEFLLSAVIHCNPDGIYNDDKYEYENVGQPFMKHLGEIIYEHEKRRSRINTPDLTEFLISYKNKE